MVEISDFLNQADGFTVPDFGRLAQVGVGATFGAFLTGVTSLVLGLFDVPISLLAGLADFLQQVVAVVVGFPGVLIERGFLAAWLFVIESGPAGLVIALGLGATAAYVFQWVISRA